MDTGESGLARRSQPSQPDQVRLAFVDFNQGARFD